MIKYFSSTYTFRLGLIRNCKMQTKMTTFFHSVIWLNSRLAQLSPESSVQNCISVYKACFLLNKLCNGTYFIPCLELCVGILISTGAYILIRLQQKLDPVSTLLVGIVLAMGLTFQPAAMTLFSIISSKSEIMQERLPSLIPLISSHGERGEAVMLLKSLPPMHCNVGKIYKMDATAKLSYLDSIINGVVFALLTF